MRFPAPGDPADSPVWQNYIIAQAAHAALGQIPEHALAVGVEASGFDVRLHFQLSALTEQDRSDVDDIASDLDDLLGDAVKVEVSIEVRANRSIPAPDGVGWIFIARPRD